MKLTDVAILIRHGDYHQLPDVPSAHQPFPLTSKGEEQAIQATAMVEEITRENGWTLDPIIHTSSLLRAWQTADILRQNLDSCESLVETERLAERGLGSGSNLTLNQLEEVAKADPRIQSLPQKWKSDSHFRLPLTGAESLMESGIRVANYLREIIEQPGNSPTNPRAILFVGHGAAFRHAAHHLGAMEFDDIARLSMFHAQPVALGCYEDGSWKRVAGEWKIRDSKLLMLD